MKSATQLWHDFLAFCAVRTPDDLLAVDFVRASLDAQRTDAHARRQAERDLRTLQALLTWRERNAERPETASAQAPDT